MIFPTKHSPAIYRPTALGQVSLLTILLVLAIPLFSIAQYPEQARGQLAFLVANHEFIIIMIQNDW